MTPTPDPDQTVNYLVTARNSSGPRTVGAAGDLAETSLEGDDMSILAYPSALARLSGEVDR